MNSMKHNLEHTYATVNKSIVYEYFRLIKNKDINGVLNLFNDDAIIYEPFSNIEGGLHGKSAIKPFLDVVLMANDGLQHKIEFVKAQDDSNNKEDNNNQVTAKRRNSAGTIHIWIGIRAGGTVLLFGWR